MRARFLLAAGLAALLGLIGTSSVQAGLTGFSSENGGGTGVTINYTPGNLANGLHSLSTTANSFTTTVTDGTTTSSYQTYCVDIYHYTHSAVAVQLVRADTFSSAGGNASNYTGNENTQTGTYDRQGLGRAAWLVNTYANQAGVDKAALQIAVWKAEYETQANVAADYNKLTAGAITFTNLDATVASHAVSYLNASWNGTAYSSDQALWFSFYKSGNTTQDQITAVPEPTTLAIAGLGALGFGAHAWRRRKRLS